MSSVVAPLQPDLDQASIAALVLVLALGVELLVGDPVSRWHPVALFGSLVQRLFPHPPSGLGLADLAYGALVVMTAVSAVALGSALLLHAVSAVSPILGLLLGGVLLKSSFSFRQLADEALLVARHLELGRILEARTALRALVSRDTNALSPGLTASAAVESVAENLNDSFVAPLLYFVVLGVPGALAYRAINTLDAQVGYHGEYEMLGKVAARLDDLANLVPARVTAGLLVITCALARANPLEAARTAAVQHARTDSPNAGWPMAAMAGALGVSLEKPGAYQLGEGAACSATTIRQAVSVTRWAAALTAGLALAGAWWVR